MARILYGVHGTGHGHAMRALTVARCLPHHEFLFVSHGHGLELLAREYQTLECPNPETPINGHKVAALAALASNIRVQGNSRRLMNLILETIDRFQPQAIISDYEYFVPRASRLSGRPCLSLDHQHIVTCCRHRIPWSQYPSFLATNRAITKLFSRASDYLIISFYQPPLKPGVRAVVQPPLLRPEVLGRRTSPGDHVLAYHGYSIFENFFSFLKRINRTVLVYGSNVDKCDGNLIYKKNSEKGFLNDLASCRYVVCGSGHTLLSEALYYGKPLLVFPIKNAFEQFLNAHYIRQLGYGDYLTTFRPRPGVLSAFEARLDLFRANITQGRFCGNEEILFLLEQFIRDGRLTGLK